MLAVIQQEQPKKLLINFDGVTHCSTAVINGLLRAKKRVVSEGGQIKLCGMVKPVREAYKMLNLDGTVFEIHDDRGGAIGAF